MKNVASVEQTNSDHYICPECQFDCGDGWANVGMGDEGKCPECGYEFPDVEVTR